jgi:hypothetical protein
MATGYYRHNRKDSQQKSPGKNSSLRLSEKQGLSWGLPYIVPHSNNSSCLLRPQCTGRRCTDRRCHHHHHKAIRRAYQAQGTNRQRKRPKKI